MRYENLSLDRSTSLFESPLMDELPHFESFFHNVGLKRVDGAIFGLLVLSEEALSSEEIESALGLSQSATSVSLKNLTHYLAIESIDCRKRRCKLHRARKDSLSIVSAIIRKREQHIVEEFKLMITRSLNYTLEHEADRTPKRITRLKSILLTCNFSQTLMSFVIALGGLQASKQYTQIIGRLPVVLDLLIGGATPIANMTSNIKTNIAHKLKGGLSKLQERYNEQQL
ncbi:MAG: hypothetical protein ISR65_08595 [Bacteriovoracaceae bacterium]|nr:hypothetical protein [Bacteriovoracaceae bacterium]